VHRVHGPVDHSRWSVHMDSRRRSTKGSLELHNTSDAGQGSSPHEDQEVEGGAGVLTTASDDSKELEIWPAMTMNDGGRTSFCGGASRARMEQNEAKNRSGVWRQCYRAPFIGRGQRSEVSGGGQRRQSWCSLKFRCASFTC
jgi:hypothetical protein